MWPNHDGLTVSLIECDEATATVATRIAHSNGLRVQSFSTALQFLEQYETAFPGCAIADFHMPDGGGWELVDVIGAEPPGLQIIFYADSLDVPTAVELMKAGVADVLIKPITDQVLSHAMRRALEIDLKTKQVHAAQAVARHHYTMLTPREREVFQLVVSGLPSKGIAQVLDRSQKTVEVHRTSIMKKMEAKSVVDLVRMGIQLRVLDGTENDRFRQHEPLAAHASASLS